MLESRFILWEVWVCKSDIWTRHQVFRWDLQKKDIALALLKCFFFFGFHRVLSLLNWLSHLTLYLTLPSIFSSSHTRNSVFTKWGFRKPSDPDQLLWAQTQGSPDDLRHLLRGAIQHVHWTSSSSDHGHAVGKQRPKTGKKSKIIRSFFCGRGVAL